MSSFLGPGQVASVLALNERAFATAIALDGRLITFDRNGVAIPAQLVVVTWANREPRDTTSGGTNVQSFAGTIEKWATLDARLGDRFMIDDAIAEVSTPVRLIDGVATVDFKLVTGRA